jgi:hypothetical protein
MVERHLCAHDIVKKRIGYWLAALMGVLMVILRWQLSTLNSAPYASPIHTCLIGNVVGPGNLLRW